MDLQFRQRQRRIFFTNVPFFPLNVGNNIYRPLSFCSEWGEIPYKNRSHLFAVGGVSYAGKGDPGS